MSYLDNISPLQDPENGSSPVNDPVDLFKRLSELSEFGIQVFDEHGTSCFINDAQKKILGLPDLQEGIGSFNVLNDPFALKTGASNYYLQAYSGHTVQREYEYNLGLVENNWNTHQEKRVLLETIIPITGCGDRVEYVAAFLHDVTNVRRNENELKESELRWKYAVEGNKDGLWDWDIETDRVFYSPEWKKMLGYGSTEISDQRHEWEDRLHPDDLEQVVEDLQAHLQGKTKFYQSEYRMLSKAGVYLWVLARGITVSYDEDGKPKRMIGTHSDISSRKEIEAEIERSRLLLQVNEEIAKTGAWEYQVHSQKISWTDGLYSIHDMEPGSSMDLISDSLKCYLPEDREKINKAFQECIQEGVSYDLVFPFVSRKNKHKWIRTRSRAVIKNGKVSRVIGSVADITEQYQAEIELKKLNATKDKFFSIIAHDLRGPLGSILGFSELSLESINRKDFNDLEIYSSYINEATQKTFGLLNNLLEWARVQTGTIQFLPVSTRFRDIVENTTELLELGIREKNLSLQTKFDPDAAILADPYMLETILRNLLSNAIKYTPSGGKIEIKLTTESQYHTIAVSDTGKGIDPELQKKLFSIEESSSTPGTNNEKGSGLGLILCKEFAKMHGGNISMTSRPGKGSTFIVHIPHRQPD